MNSLLLDVPVGDKVYFEGEVQGYTVQARNDRYIVCTKPFNPRKTVLYCIVDLKNDIRGPEGVTFSIGAETRDQCEAMLDRVAQGTSEISYRNRTRLLTSKVVKGADRFCGFCNRTTEDGPCGMSKRKGACV
jgi:hypothetical protein